MIPIFNTYIAKNANDYINKTLDSTFISEGEQVKIFEKKLSSTVGLINPLALNSGTSALHLALVTAGIEKGDEVICPAQTFIATSLVIIQQGAIPVFADINYNTGNIDPISIKQKITPRTKAIMIVHWAGYPCDIDEILAIAKEHNLVVIEDAAHAIGATYKNNWIGSISDYTCFSFQAIKHVTTGDGGALAIKDSLNYQKALSARWFGINRHTTSVSELGERTYNVSEIGFKYHLNDYGASLGIVNLEHFLSRLEQRRKWASLYRKELANVAGIKLFESNDDRKSAYWLFGFHVENRLQFVRSLKEKGITASVIHQRIDRNDIFGGICGDLVNQAEFDKSQIHIPMHDALTDEKVEYIIDTIKAGW